MGKIAEQFSDVVSAANSNVDFVNMWKGPVDATEIENAIAGNPTLVPCCVGPNLNDGRGTQGFKERKGFMTIKEMHQWLAEQEPEKQTFPCPYCIGEDGEFGFIGDSATALADHIQDKHQPEAVIQTPNYEAAKREQLLNDLVEANAAEAHNKALKKNKGGRPKGSGSKKTAG